MEKISSSAEDLKTIRKIMEESSRFLSLSGLSGVFAGITAIAGALVAWYFILDKGAVNYDEYFKTLSEKGTATLRWQIILDGLLVLLLSLLAAFYFSARKARKEGRNLWSPVSRRMLVNLAIPLITGGVFTILLIAYNHSGLVVPALLIFYGLALVGAGKFTYGEIFYLGLLEIATGLAAVLFPSLGIIFWILGFGVLHIIYGLFMFRKYEA